MTQKILSKEKFFSQVGYQPHLGQRELHYTPSRFKVVSNGRRWGKALSLDTPIPTPSGFVPMGKLEAGDLVFSSLGKAIPILEAHPHYYAEEVYAITFDDGSELVADADHLWFIYTFKSRRAINDPSRHTQPEVVTTRELIKRLKDKPSVPIVSAAVQYSPQLQPLADPYLIGRWLGDGSKNNGKITSLREDAGPIVRRGGVEKYYGNSGQAFGYLVPGFQAQLQKLGLIPNKHIPDSYLYGSEETRRQLLAGFVDSDGWVENNRRVRISQSNELLANQLCQLIESLGYKVNVHHRPEPKYQRGIGQYNWVLTFNPGYSVAELERKASTGTHLPHKHGQRYIKKITPVSAQMVRCITVDSPDSLYLAGTSFIPTHNTFFGGYEAEVNAFVVSHVTGKPQHGWIVGPQYQDAEKEFRIVYDDFRRLGVSKNCIKFLNNPDAGYLHIKTDWGFELEGKSAKHPETLVGEGLDFVLMVEAGRQIRRTWAEYIRPALSDKRGWALFTGVPEGKSENSLLYSLWQRGQDSHYPAWQSWTAPSWTNNIVFPGGRQDPEILEAEADLTEDEFARQYGAEFRDKIGVVMQEWDYDLHVKDIPYLPSWKTYMAVDFGFTNLFVVLFIQVSPDQEHVHVLKEVDFRLTDTPEVCRSLLSTCSSLIRVTEAIYPDPAGPDDAQVMSRLLRIPSRMNTGGTLDNRIKIIRRLLKEVNTHLPQGHIDRKAILTVDRSCQNLIWEMGNGYKWPEHKAELKSVKSESENPLDKDNHAVEALGRFARGMFKNPMLGKNKTTISDAQLG